MHLGIKKRFTLPGKTRVGAMRMFLSISCLVLVSITIGGCSIFSFSDKYLPLRNLLSQNKYDEVIAICNEKLRSSPADAEYLAYKGLCESRIGKSELAQADLLKAIELDAKTGWYHRELGNVYFNEGKNKEAVRSLTKSLSSEVDAASKAFIHSTLAVAHLRMDESKKSVIEATEALMIDPKQKYTYVTRAEAYLDLFELEKALADANKAVELDDKSPGAYATRSKIYFQMGECEKAIADAQTALGLDKNFWQATEILSAVNIAKGRSFANEALRAVDQLIERYPDAAVGYADKACCLLIKGDIEQARKLADKALEVEPDSVRAMQVRLQIAARSGDKVKVEKLIERFKADEMINEQRISRSRAMALVFLRDYEEAIEILNELVEHGDKAPANYRIRSEAYRRSGQNKLADADMKAALAQGYSTVSVMEQYWQAQ